MPRFRRSAARALAAALLLTGLGACTEDSGSTEAFCTRVKEVPALESVLARFSEADPDVLADRIAKARSAYDDLADAAPPEIADETDEVVSLVNDILDAVEQHPTDPAKASAQLRTAVAAHEGVASDRSKVADYAQDECDVQLDAALTEGSASTSTTSSTIAGTAPGGTVTTTTGGWRPEPAAQSSGSAVRRVITLSIRP
ncbi:hypothetical protein ACE2AJ_18050 [Aquihabitans daechungensis]|uniref:hypothetical protein n=1 Tax=Aquihabitans daechungensis TaxID=1052257 RepID=UPI003BA3CB38